MNSSTVAWWVLDALLLLWGAAGWKRAIAAEKEEQKVNEFYNKLPQWTGSKTA